jgi:hypothetical protein
MRPFSEIRYTEDSNIFNSLKNLKELIFNILNSTIEGKILIITYNDSWINQIKTINIVNENKNRILIVKNVENIKNKFECIIDMMKKERYILTITGGIRNKIEYISKREAIERAKKGKIVYRMISQNTFENLYLESNNVNSKSLHQQMLDEHKNSKINLLTEERNIIYKLFLDFQILDISLKITSKGNYIRKMPFGIKPSLLAYEVGGYEGIVLASLIDSFNGSPYLFNKSLDLKKDTFEYQIDRSEHIRKYYEKFRGNSDIETLLNIYIEWFNSNIDLEKWCQENNISYSYLKDVDSIIKQTIQKMNITSKKINTFDIIDKSKV